MTFDLHIARTNDPAFGLGRGDAPQPSRGVFGLFSKRGWSRPISVAEFHDVMADAPAQRRPDGNSYWVRYPDDSDRSSYASYSEGRGSPWFAARHEADQGRTGGKIVLSLSYTHYAFVPVMADAFDMALRLAGGLGASVFEEVEGSTVRPRDLDRLLAPTGRYVTFQGNAWMDGMKRSVEENTFPIEYPLDVVGDVVSSICLVLHVHPSAPFSTDRAREAVGGSDLAIDVEWVQPNAAFVRTRGTDRIVAQLLVREDGRLQVWPYAWWNRFSDVASLATMLARQVANRSAGRLYLFDKPLEGALASEFDQRLRGLGVEFYEWLRERPEFRTS